jgi:hypothetical protein
VLDGEREEVVVVGARAHRWDLCRIVDVETTRKHVREETLILGDESGDLGTLDHLTELADPARTQQVLEAAGETAATTRLSVPSRSASGFSAVHGCSPAFSASPEQEAGAGLSGRARPTHVR